MSNQYKYIALYKPYDVLSQFTKEVETHRTLADYLNVDKDIYPIGRLDRDSEGLLLLSNDKSLVDKLLNPKNHYRKTYYVQVEGAIDDEAIRQLSEGVQIRIKKKVHQTLACNVHAIEEPQLPERIPPIRERKSIPTSWISISLTEGKNRQVRRMCAAVGFPVLRLVRWSIESVDIRDLLPGESKSIRKSDILP